MTDELRPTELERLEQQRNALVEAIRILKAHYEDPTRQEKQLRVIEQRIAKLKRKAR